MAATNISLTAHKMNLNNQKWGGEKNTTRFDDRFSYSPHRNSIAIARDWLLRVQSIFYASFILCMFVGWGCVCVWVLISRIVPIDQFSSSLIDYTFFFFLVYFSWKMCSAHCPSEYDSENFWNWKKRPRR